MCLMEGRKPLDAQVFLWTTEIANAIVTNFFQWIFESFASFQTFIYTTN